MNKSLLTWEPPVDILSKSFFSQLLDWDLNPTMNSHVPKSDIYENESSLFFKMAMPGVNQEDVRVVVENNVLTIKGETKSDLVDKTTNVYRRELHYGSFNRSFRLPGNAVVEQAVATVEKGVITVEIPKSEAREVKLLEVPVNAVKSLE